MTAIVGVLCSDGAVIGTDSSTTFTAGQLRTIEQLTEKLEVVAERIVIAGTGPEGLGQRFKAVIENAWNARVFQRAPLEVGKEICRSAQIDFGYTSVSEGQYSALVAFPGTNGKPCLCEFAVPDLQPELKSDRIWYCSLGSSQLITDPFLAFMRDVFWEGGPPSIQGATFAVTWTLDHVVDVNPGGVNAPVRIAVLEPGEKGQLMARLLDENELAEHRQLIAEAKTRLRGLANSFGAESTANAPDVPQPGSS